MQPAGRSAGYIERLTQKRPAGIARFEFKESMSKFSVLVRKIRAIEPHTNAETLEMAVIDDYRSAIKKDKHSAGDLVVYIPEASVATPFILKLLGLWDHELDKGLCAGPYGTRVKPVLLRGRLSQGIVYPIVFHEGQWLLPIEVDGKASLTPVEEGQEVADLLGIVKYKPEIPAELLGDVFDPGIENLPNFDVEDIKRYPDMFQEGEEVVYTEKLHGTFLGCALLPEPVTGHGDFLIFSKGLAESAMAFRVVSKDAGNAYVRAALEFEMRDRLVRLRERFAAEGRPVDGPVFVFGEMVGSASRQDLKYGTALGLRAFAIGHGGRATWISLDRDEFEEAAKFLGLEITPLLYRGPFSKESLENHTTGKETYSGKSLHIREGVVVTPVVERRHPDIGRVCLKSVSPNYLIRKGNPTEYS